MAQEAGAETALLTPEEFLRLWNNADDDPLSGAMVADLERVVAAAKEAGAREAWVEAARVMSAAADEAYNKADLMRVGIIENYADRFRRRAERHSRTAPGAGRNDEQHD